MTPVHLTGEEWKTVIAPFEKKAFNAQEERERIAHAIANMEQVVGEKSGTYRDKAGATIRGHGFYQLDCIDETANTNKYLKFFKGQNLIRFHDISGPARRGTFIDGAWPHNTAVVTQTSNGQSYAIDSWFHENGKPPTIIPLDEWLEGWTPEKTAGANGA